MNGNLGVVVVVVPPSMVEALLGVVDGYATATGQPANECRRLVEVGVLTRGLRAMQVEVEEQRKLAERMGWPR